MTYRVNIATQPISKHGPLMTSGYSRSAKPKPAIRKRSTSDTPVMDWAEKIGKEADMDRFFTEDPEDLSDADLLEQIGLSRRERAMYINKGDQSE